MKNFRLTLMLLSIAWLTFSCSDDDNSDGLPDTSQSFGELEGEYIRLAMIVDSTQMMVMNPVSEQTTFTVNEPMTPGARYYLSPTGRYLVSIERAQNQTRFFDVGIVNHTDHGHEYAANWLDNVVTSPMPTHYSDTGDDIVIFNDGDASILHIEESRLEFAGYQPPVIPVATTAHHGAVVRLVNGLFATTFRDESIEDALPQIVKLVDDQGQVQVDNEDVRVGRIHGNTSNGNVALFGSTDGVVVASAKNEIFLIPNVDTLMNAERGNWIGTVRGHDNLDVFYGWARAQGLFRIDPASQSMTRFYEGDDVKSFFFSEDGTYLILHKTDDEIVVYDAASGNEMTQEVIAIAPDAAYDNARREAPTELERLRLMEEPERVLTASAEFLYVLEPSQTEINVLRLSDLSSVKTMTLDSPVDVIMRVGFHRKENIAW